MGESSKYFPNEAAVGFLLIKLSWIACVCGDPIYFPVFAAIIRKGLFEMARVGSDVPRLRIEQEYQH